MLAIVCIDNNWGIGNHGDQLYYLKPDLRRFRRLTENRVVIFGRRTMQTFPEAKPLAKRHNILLSNSIKTAQDDPDTPFYIVRNREQLLAIKGHLSAHGYRSEDMIVIGGASVYREFLPAINRVLVTRVLNDFEADTYFPNLDQSAEWFLSSSGEVQHDQETGLDFVYQEYRRKTITATPLFIRDANLVAELKLNSKRLQIQAIAKWIRQMRQSGIKALKLHHPTADKLIGIAVASNVLTGDVSPWKVYLSNEFSDGLSEDSSSVQQIIRAIQHKDDCLVQQIILPINSQTLNLQTIAAAYQNNEFQFSDGYLWSGNLNDISDKQYFCLSFEHINICVGILEGRISNIQLLDQLKDIPQDILIYLSINGILDDRGGIIESRLAESIKQDREIYSENLLYRKVRSQLSAYFARQRTHFDLPLAIAHESDFRSKVWQVIAKIPYGHTLSYEEVATETLKLMDKDPAKASAYARAVGMACSANPLAIVLPCHRVIGKDHTLRGFAAGTDIKANLLDREILGIDR